MSRPVALRLVLIPSTPCRISSSKPPAEPGFGHYEVFAILQPLPRSRLSLRRARIAASTTVTVQVVQPWQLALTTALLNVGGFGGNARVTLFKQLDIGATFSLPANGIGRYGTGGSAGFDRSMPTALWLRCGAIKAWLPLSGTRRGWTFMPTLATSTSRDAGSLIQTILSVHSRRWATALSTLT